jgi:hypothetical protein
MSVRLIHHLPPARTQGLHPCHPLTAVGPGVGAGVGKAVGDAVGLCPGHKIWVGQGTKLGAVLSMIDRCY